MDNFLHIKRYRGEAEDRELYNLIPFLKDLATYDDVSSANNKLRDFVRISEHLKSTSLQKKVTLKLTEEKTSATLTMKSDRKQETYRTSHLTKTLKAFEEEETKVEADAEELAGDEADECFVMKNQIIKETGSDIFRLMKEDVGLQVRK